MPKVCARIYNVMRGFDYSGQYPGQYRQVFAEHLCVNLVRDNKNAFIHIDKNILDDWKISAVEAHDIAMKNLEAATVGQFAKGAAGIYFSQWNDFYDSTRILLTDRIRELKVAGNPVAIVPNDNTLAITGSDDNAGILELIGWIKTASDKYNFNCGYMFALTEEG